MDKIWLKSYPPGVPAEIDPSRYSSVAELLEEAFREHRAKPAFVCMGKEISYGELDALSRKLAAWFQSKGLARGARIAIMMPNVLQYPVAIAAILRAGYVVVNVNPLYTPRELEHQLKDSGAEAIILLENFAVTLAGDRTQYLDQARRRGGDGRSDGHQGHAGELRRAQDEEDGAGLEFAGPRQIQRRDRGRRAARHFKPVQQGPDDVAFLQYTGGTTGVAKGATLLHRNLIANVLQSEVWLDPVRANRTDIDQFITVVALPLYHVFALTVCGLLTIRTGGLGVLIPNPRDIPGHDQGAAKAMRSRRSPPSTRCTTRC